MKKIYALVLGLALSGTLVAQTTIDLSALDAQFTTTFENELVLDVAKTSSAVASPLVSFPNPYKEAEFEKAIISFDVYNYGDLKVLGALFSFFDAEHGRMYFTNGSYFGFNAMGSWVDVNVVDFKMAENWLGSAAWVSVRMEIDDSGFSIYVNDELVGDSQGSTEVVINTDAENPIQYDVIAQFLKVADSFVIGTGSWWSDNTDENSGEYFDLQYSYLKNIVLAIDAPTSIAAPVAADKGELVSESYFTITGAPTDSDFNALTPGIYVKRTIYSSGLVESTKVVKGSR